MNQAWQARRFDEVKKSRLNDHRSPYQRDRARVLHSAAFRRLQAKTQIHGVGSSDFYRTRLTHSLEAAQIGTGIHAQLVDKYPASRPLLGPSALAETLCLAHDLGHPPFGHGGEIALHYMMRDHGGFEGNGQTFRIVTTLEPYTKNSGMNLARRTLLGLIKYPVLMSCVSHPPSEAPPVTARELKAEQWHPAKSLYDCDKKWFEWVLEPLTKSDRARFTQFKERKPLHSKSLYKSLDCSIMELADDIAYGIHDLEDAITLNRVNRQQWQQANQELMHLDAPWLSEQITSLSDKLFDPAPYIRKDAIGALVNYFITSIELRADLPFDAPLLSHNAYLPLMAAAALKVFKQFVFNHVICSYELQSAEYRGQQVIMDLFAAYASDPERLLPDEAKSNWTQAKCNEQAFRAIADWVSSLTDQSAQRIYRQLFV